MKKTNNDVFRQGIVKPWGREVLWTPPTIMRVGKFIFIKAGHRLSLQYHELKEETLCLVSGKANLLLADAAGRLRCRPMKLEHGYTIEPGRMHRLVGVTDCLIVEVSDAEKGKTFRLADDFGRPDETDALRKKRNRGWSARKRK